MGSLQLRPSLHTLRRPTFHHQNSLSATLMHVYSASHLKMVGDLKIDHVRTSRLLMHYQSLAGPVLCQEPYFPPDKSDDLF
jgi:hypothetical protein